MLQTTCFSRPEKKDLTMKNTDRRIAIDVGHARGTGARGNGLQEHEVCVKLGEYLREELAKRGFAVEVVDFPGRTNSGDLVATVQHINAGEFALSVSLHCDAADNAGARGAHVIHVSEKGELVARAIATHLCPIMPGRANRVVKRGNLYVLNNTRCPAVLVECGFLTNSRDADMLRYEGRRIALAIAVGVEEALCANEF